MKKTNLCDTPRLQRLKRKTINRQERKERSFGGAISFLIQNKIL